MTSELDQQRAEFEDWTRLRGLSLRRRQQAQEEYDDLGTHDAWAAWQYIEAKARADEREAIAQWMEGQGQPGYAHEIRCRALT